METTASRSIHPLTAIAAVSLILFSLAGIGAITGLIPISHSQNAQMQAVKPAQEPLNSLLSTSHNQNAQMQAATPAPESLKPLKLATAAQAADRPVARKAVAKQAKPAARAPLLANEPVLRDETPVRVAQNDPLPRYDTLPRYESAQRMEAARPACYDCGVIESVREIEKKGAGSGVGAVAGGVAGGLLGHQTGAGRGKDVMTVLGAIGGAVAGHQIEKTVKKVKSYEIAVRFEDGSSQLVTQDNQPAWRSGDKVRLVNGVITASN